MKEPKPKAKAKPKAKPADLPDVVPKEAITGPAGSTEQAPRGPGDEI